MGVCLLIPGNNSRYFIGVGGQTPRRVERVSAFPPSIFRGGRRVHTKVCYNGIENRGNIPGIVLEGRMGGCLYMHRMGEKDQVEKL